MHFILHQYKKLWDTAFQAFKDQTKSSACNAKDVSANQMIY